MREEVDITSVWEITFFDGEKELCKYLKANDIVQVIKRISQKNWNLDVNFVKKIELLDNGFGFFEVEE